MPIRDRLPDLHAAASARGGACLSAVYQGREARYRFRCRDGHEWESTVRGILTKGQWCRRCCFAKIVATRRSRPGSGYLKAECLAQLHAVAAAKGGVCLSTEYRGLAGRYRFRCHQGHEWEALGTSRSHKVLKFK